MTNSIKTRIKSFSPITFWREILALLMLLLAIVFFRSERKELHTIVPQIEQANPVWLTAGFLVTILLIYLQAGMYKKCFAAIGLALSWGKAAILFLKRNFISVFLPAGGVSALAYSPSQIRKAGYNKIQVHQASGLFGFAGLVTVFLAGLPVIIFTVFATDHFKNSWIGLLAVLLIISSLLFIVQSIRKKGKLYQWIDKHLPSVTPTLNELFAANVNRKKFYGAVGFSMGVELSGMIHIYIAMLALGVQPSFGAAAGAYIISITMMVISPFLRGLGAVELSMVYVLQQYGYSSVDSLSITLLYRIFEFWLPLLAGFLSFAWKGRKIFLRLAPALLTFLLGIINIISVVTPPLTDRLHLLREYLPLATIRTSNLLVLFIGIALLVISAFLFRGLRNAWILALSLSIISLIGHLTKALDYEEAIIAALTVTVLITTASQYRIHSSNKWIQTGLKTALISIAAVALFGFISFYFIDKKHFNEDFTWQQSLLHTFKSFLLITDNSLHPVTRFGHEFIEIIRALGFITWGFLLFMLIRPNLRKHVKENNNKERAALLLSDFGNSSVDYFKLYRDKLYFFSEQNDGFIAYRVSRGFAVVLEAPVCAPENKIAVLEEFELQCHRMGLKPAFYRVDENSIPWFNQLKKQKLMIGQEAILELEKFNLEGRDKKSLRNGLNSLQKKGFTCVINKAPHKPEFLSELKKVSDEWLESIGKREYIFSQGMFDQNELKAQDIISLHDDRNSIKAFLNIIPDYAEDECTYDLIRKTNDAPGAVMDALIIKLIEYAKEKNQLFLNLGLVPLSGITEPDNTAEQIIKIAAEKIKRFQHYKGLREFKEKYATLWENKYLIYNNDFDLLQLPIAINQVMKV